MPKKRTHRQTFAFPIRSHTQNRNLRVCAWGRFKERTTVRIDVDTLQWVQAEADRLGCSVGSLIGFALQAAKGRAAGRQATIAELVRESEAAYCQRFGIEPPAAAD